MVLKGERGRRRGARGIFLVSFRSGSAPSKEANQTDADFKPLRLLVGHCAEKGEELGRRRLRGSFFVSHPVRLWTVTYHIDLRHHVNTGDVYAHANIHRGAYGKYDSRALVSITAAR